MSWLIVITLAAVGSVVVAALLLWWRVPKWQMRSITAADPKARADIEDNFRKTIGQLLGGAAVLIGAALAYVQFTQQQQTSQRQFTQQQQASRDLLISNQVAKGFEQLGSDKIVIRLARQERDTERRLRGELATCSGRSICKVWWSMTPTTTFLSVTIRPIGSRSPVPEEQVS
jgi:hypothetical protein